MTNRLGVALAAIDDVRVAPVTKLRVAANQNGPARNAEMAAHDAKYAAFNEKLAAYMRGETKTPAKYTEQKWVQVKSDWAAYYAEEARLLDDEETDDADWERLSHLRPTDILGASHAA